MDHTSPADLLADFKVRHQHCYELLQLSKRQRNLIDSADYTQLLTILAEKQRLLGRLDQWNKAHPDLRRRWQNLRHTADTELRDDCEHVLAESEALLADLLEEERHSTEELQRRRDAAQQQLLAISQGARLHDAYRESLAPSSHRLLDVGQ